MTNDNARLRPLTDGDQDPDEETGRFHGGTDAGVPTPERERVGGSGPGPVKDDTDEPELGIGPYGAADAAGGGYGTMSGRSSGGSGDGEPGSPTMGTTMDDGTTSGATGAADVGPTTWLRGASEDVLEEDALDVAADPVGKDTIGEGRVRGVTGVGHPSAGQGQGG